MGVKNIVRSYSAIVIIFLLLASCQGGNTPSDNGNIALSATETELLYLETGTHTETYTPSPSPILATATQTLTSTRVPPGAKLKDWREPVEVITSENIHRVEKIGEIEISRDVFRMGWSPEDSWFGVSTFSSDLFVFDASNFSIKWMLHGYFVAFSPDEKVLETGTYQYDLLTGEETHEGQWYPIEEPPNKLLDIEYSPDGRYIVAGGTYIAKIVPISIGLEGGIFGRRGEEVVHTSISPDGSVVAVNYGYESFSELWDPNQRKPIKIIKIKNISTMGKPRFVKDGNSLFITGRGMWEEQEVSFLQEWNYKTGNPKQVYLLPGLVEDRLSSIDVSPISNIIAIGTIDNNLYLFQSGTCNYRKINDNDSNKSEIWFVAFKPDGKVIATATNIGNSITLWGIPSSRESLEPIITRANTPDNQTECPKIPMDLEIPIPKADWFGGGKP